MHSVLKEVQVGLLPIDNTHVDIDQVFSRTSEGLQSTEAITVLHMHE